MIVTNLDNRDGQDLRGLPIDGRESFAHWIRSRFCFHSQLPSLFRCFAPLYAEPHAQPSVGCCWRWSRHQRGRSLRARASRTRRAKAALLKTLALPNAPPETREAVAKSTAVAMVAAVAFARGTGAMTSVLVAASASGARWPMWLRLAVDFRFTFRSLRSPSRFHSATHDAKLHG